MVLRSILLFVALLGFFVGRSLQSYDNSYPESMYSCNRSRSIQACPNLTTNCCCTYYYGLEAYLVQDPKITLQLVYCKSLEDPPKFLPNGTQGLFLDTTRFSKLDRSSFDRTSITYMGRFELSNNPRLRSIGEEMFSGLKRLRVVIIQDVKNLEYIGGSAFSDTPLLRTIQLINTGLKKIYGFNKSNFGRGEYIHLIISENPRLTRVQANAFRGTPERLSEIKIINNPALKSIDDYAFNHSSVRFLKLDNNEALTDLSRLAFANSIGLWNLSFENTKVRTLPTAGLQTLTTLKAQNVPTMTRFPDIFQLRRLRKAKLTYSYHCCAINAEYGFGHLNKNGKSYDDGVTKYYCDTGELYVEKETWWNEADFDEELEPLKIIFNSTDEPLKLDSVNGRNKRELRAASDASNSQTNIASGDMSDLEFIQPVAGTKRYICYKDEKGQLKILIYRRHFDCTPNADAFNPCEDLLGSSYLAGISWCVAWMSVIGNLVVLTTMAYIVYDFFRNKRDQLTVSKFLILNLSAADLLLGIYILSLAVMDGKTTGSYYRYGVEWQTRFGCGVVGFIAVLSSQQSVFTLAVISIERWYAIQNAIHLEKRIKLKFAAILMGSIWIFSIILATLPLAGINGYTKSAICLPLDVKQISGLIYVGILLFLDIFAFCVVVGCYISMYFLVGKKKFKIKSRLLNFFKPTCLHKKTEEATTRVEKNHRKENSGVINNRDKDARIAWLMAVLIFTDFVCLFPICLFSLLAVAGVPLISLSISKILLVVFFPINSCFNPFLYAILTKSFRKDLMSFIKFLKQASFRKDQRKKIPSHKKQEIYFFKKKDDKTKKKQKSTKRNNVDPEDPTKIGKPKNNSCGGALSCVKSSGSDHVSGLSSTSKNTSGKTVSSSRTFDTAGLTPSTDVTKLSRTSNITKENLSQEQYSSASIASEKTPDDGFNAEEKNIKKSVFQISLAVEVETSGNDVVKK